ncbi:MAG: response regulator [Candidatus Margulisiibacteriota bacterium]
MTKKILVVDDEADIIKIVTVRLKAAKFDVISATDGKAGLEMAKKEKPDLIILDLMLPKMDGYMVCGLLKHDFNFKNIPIILFTARDQAVDKQKGMEVLADAYITKPFEPETLISKVNELLTA